MSSSRPSAQMRQIEGAARAASSYDGLVLRIWKSWGSRGSSCPAPASGTAPNTRRSARTSRIAGMMSGERARRQINLPRPPGVPNLAGPDYVEAIVRETILIARRTAARGSA